jgi:membrane associated rhomboid family serine protease
MGVQPEQGTGNPPSGPTCFRHPGRETYLSCVRCGRPACPECLREAPVGHQCVECVKEGTRGTRRPVTVFGGRAVAGSLVTYVLVGLNIALYLVEWIYPRIVNYLWLVGDAYDGTLHRPVGVAHGEAYRLITSAFLHEPGTAGFGPAHIIFNMWALLLVGPALERLLGRARFIALYLLSALGGAVLFYLIVPPQQTALGASGAIFGLFGAWFVVARKLRVDTRSIVFLIVINLAIGFFASSAIAWQDHIGGLITGGLLTAAFAYAPAKNRTLIQVAAALAVVALLVIAVLARNHDLLTTLG